MKAMICDVCGAAKAVASDDRNESRPEGWAVVFAVAAAQVGASTSIPSDDVCSVRCAKTAIARQLSGVGVNDDPDGYTHGVGAEGFA